MPEGNHFASLRKAKRAMETAKAESLPSKVQFEVGVPSASRTNFTSEEIRDFNWSADGKQLAIMRGHADSDVVLLGAVSQD